MRKILVCFALLFVTPAIAQSPGNIPLTICHGQLSNAEAQLETVVAQYEAKVADLQKQIDALKPKDDKKK